MDQNWFEMKNIRLRDLEKAAWIPLRSALDIRCEGEPGHVGFLEERLRVGSLAVPMDNRLNVLALRWDEVGSSYDHSGTVQDGRYIPAEECLDHQERSIGVHLVLDQRGLSGKQGEWHLNQDFVLTLALEREEDTWVRPEEGFIEVARLKRASDGSAAQLEVRTSHLKDYLCARQMGLALNSYRVRCAVIEDTARISWGEDDVEEKDEYDRWVGSKMAIHEGGQPFGGSVAVIHARRVDVNPEDDIPVLGPPMEAKLQSRSWTKHFQGRKLYRISGELWRKEWLKPGLQSPIVRGDKVSNSVSFIIGTDQERVAGDLLVDSGRWLWFRPTVICALSDRRGGSLNWYSRDTGAVACSPGHDVYFGINSAGLVNTYAKHVALLPVWQQQEWAAHSTYPAGGLSEELKASQIDAVPASTVAPEALLAQELDRLQEIAQVKLKIKLRRQHHFVDELMPRIHRFRVTAEDGLFALAKDLARITADDIDQKQLQAVVGSPNDKHEGSLKSLEKVLASRIPPADARAILGPLVGVYQLRMPDAHLPSGDLAQSMDLVGIDRGSPLVVQGYQLIHAAVEALHRIGTVIEESW